MLGVPVQIAYAVDGVELRPLVGVSGVHYVAHFVDDFEMVRDASAGWDGTHPLRRL